MPPVDADTDDTGERIATARGVTIGVEQVVYFPPQPFTPHLVEAVRANARVQEAYLGSVLAEAQAAGAAA